MSPEDKHARIGRYADAYAGDYGFESVMVAARQKMALEVIARHKPQIVLEAGCGSDLLVHRAAAAGLPVRLWVTVEPAEAFARIAASAAPGPIGMRVIQGFFEDSRDAALEACGRAPDLVLMAGLLNEVPNPARLVGAARALLEPGGVFHASVPNAFSFHRRLARAMGLIPQETARSLRNEALAQYHNFDLPELAALVRAAGFTVQDSGGYLMKPFTHQQMESLGQLTTPALLDGLWQLGRELPEWASEIYVTAQAAP